MRGVEWLNGGMVEGFVSEKGDKKSPHFVSHVILRKPATEEPHRTRHVILRAEPEESHGVLRGSFG